MTLEIARIDVHADKEEDFLAGASKARPLFLAAKGCSAMSLARSAEVRSRYWLMVEWADIAAHEAFRQTADFAEWRRLVGACFATAPVVEHGLAIDLG